MLCSALLAGFLAFGAACRKPPAGSPETAAKKTEPAAAAKDTAAKDAAAAATPPWADPKKPVPAQLPDVLARINGEPVSKVDFDRLVKNMETAAGRPIPAERRDELLRGALDELVTLHLLSQEAKSRNITVPESDIDSNINALRKPNEEQFQAALAARGMTIEQMRADAAIQMRINKMMQGEVSTVPGATEAEAREFYDKYPDRFKPEEVRASHILIKVPNNDEATVKKAQARAESVLKQAQAGADFADLARKYSDDDSKKNGGDLNFFQRGKFQRELQQFETTAFSLKTGQVSEIVATPYGFHIIKVTDRRVLPITPFEDVSSQIRELLFSQRKEEKAKALLDSLRKKAKIEVMI